MKTMDRYAVAPEGTEWSTHEQFDSTFRWEYQDGREKLLNLYEKGKVHQWNAELDLDWSIPVSKDEWIVDIEVSLLAQILRLMGKDEATQRAAAFDELTAASHKLAEVMYQSTEAGAEAPGAPSGGGNDSDGDVIDAEFEDA